MLFSLLSRPFRNANILQTKLLSSPFSGNQYLLSTRNLEKKFVAGAKNVFALCFFRPILENPKMKSCWLQGRGRKVMSGRGSAFSQGGGESEGGEMERAGKGRRKSPAPAAAGGAGEVAQETHGDGPESKRERVDQGEAGDERNERGEELPGQIMSDHACASQR